ncbi:MAG: hypothetical protein JW940_13420 [Polyangiaceae bacterium]|nr:hypothetical protein [Polyangiaceae bacterium]
MANTEGLMGRLLDRTEGWAEPFVLADPVAEGVPAIAWDGTSFVVAWAEDKKAMWSRNVSPDGALSEPERLFSGDYGFVNLTPGADGQLLLGYVRWLEWARSRRVESRLVGELADGIAVLPRDTQRDAGTDPEPDAGTDPEVDAGSDPEQGTGGTGSAATSTGGKGGGAASTGGNGAQSPTTGGSGASGPIDPMDAGATTPGQNDAGKADAAGPDDTADAASAAAEAEAEAPAKSRSEDEGGCSVSRTSTRGGLAWLSVLLGGALMLRRRRRC